jgi:hypothetical protein
MNITGKFQAVTEHFGGIWSSEVLRMMLLNVIAAAYFLAGDADNSSSVAAKGFEITIVVNAVRSAVEIYVSRAVTLQRQLIVKLKLQNASLQRH